MSKKSGAYPVEFRNQMVQLVRAGRTAVELAREFGCHSTSISTWVRQAQIDETGTGHLDAPLTSQERQELTELRRQVKQVQMERDILAKATAWFANNNANIKPPFTR